MVKFYWKCCLMATLILMQALTLQAQDRSVTGTVSDEAGVNMPGVNILLKGTTSGTVTDSDGRYSINVPGGDAIIVFSFVGYETSEVTVGDRSVIDFQMIPDVQTLTELVVTGYTAEQKKDIIGSVSVVSSKDLLATPAPNLVTQLQGRAAGVTVSSPGQPGAASSIRIRGFTTFGNNTPLYIVDGVPTVNPGQLNPQDIESVQVLKDAASASIYGARAANGIIVVTTKSGKPGESKLTYESFYGVQKLDEVRFPKLMNTQQYADYIWDVYNGAPPAGHDIFGNGATPVIPTYLINNPQNNSLPSGGSNTNPLDSDPGLYSTLTGSPFTVASTSAGTDWFREITQTGAMQSHQITLTGGSNKNKYSLGLNYFDQEGVIIHSSYKRGTIRANTLFNIKDNIRLGENLQIGYEDRTGAAIGDPRGEGFAWSMAYRMVPYIPVYDLNGGFAGNGIGDSGNGSNPVADLTRGKDNKSFGYRIFGNAFAEVDLLKNFTARTSIGIDYDNDYNKFYLARTYERSENISTDRSTENYDYDQTWIWTNTVRFAQDFSDHNVKVLVGSEALQNTGRYLQYSRENYDLTDPDFIGADTGHGTPAVTGNTNQQNPDTYRETLYSLFGRVDYSYNDKYLFNATLRRDGSSKFAPGNQYGTFPAFGIGWRLSEEPFLNGRLFTDLKLRASWGQVGSMRNVPTINQYSIYVASPYDRYAISGGNNGGTVGYRLSRLGNPNTRWETAETTNIGIDAAILGGKIDISADYFKTETKDLLVFRQASLLEPTFFQPYMNVGTMENKGLDLKIGYRTRLAKKVELNTALTFTHYRNEVTKLDAEGTGVFTRNDRSNRQNGQLRTEAGHPMSSFYGYQIEGFYDNAEEIANSPAYPNARVGGWKLRDLNGDDRIDENDKTYLGSPIPDFQMGLNISLTYKNFDFSTFLFLNYGNEIYNFTKFWTHLRGFTGGVSPDVIREAWTPETASSASIPSLAPGDAVSSSLVTDYYIESGSYLRAKNIQLGYNLPSDLTSKLKIEQLRVYVQAQNLFTITEYTGADPDINIQNRTDDTIMGIDESGYPNARQFLIGVNVTF